MSLHDAIPAPARPVAHTRRRPRIKLVTLLSAAWLSFVVLAILAPGVLWPADAYSGDIAARLQGPSRVHPFGTDEFGRDLLARTIHGSRYSVGVAAIVVAVVSLLGGMLGAVAGWYRGMFETVIMRAADLTMAFPLMILAIALISALGPGLQNVGFALVFVWWGQYARVMRGQVLQVREREFVEAARAIGALDSWIIWKHVLPAALGPLLVKATVDVGVAVLLIGGLSFIGLGAQPPLPEWGALVSSSRKFLLSYWWYAVLPGAVLFLTVASINLFGDALLSIADPHVREKI